ncbi:MAG TPA: hypothetical protein PKM73_15200 [Verrucomicrobiota bacterium]|nr:hypothetical protein [Verrucomicrobiota bacterium]HNU52677.1 hypothetical protein [Verrucomicrobiota bacterium]
MAIDLEVARLLLSAAKRSASFENTLTLGRQAYLPGHKESHRLLREFGFDPAACNSWYSSDRSVPYAEGFFRLLGARRLDSLDVGAFENATIIHDLNRPIPDDLVGQFDVVLDCGTLEHVFNFPTAVANCMRMTKLGGRIILQTPANNFFGHGLYQFSPELFYLLFSEKNGFVTERLLAIEYAPRRRTFHVFDPAQAGLRASLINSYPVLLFVQARKETEKPLFLEWPAQHEYATPSDPGKTWATVDAIVRSQSLPQSDRIKRQLIDRAPRLARYLEGFLFSRFNPSFSWRNRRAFRRLNRSDLDG